MILNIILAFIVSCQAAKPIPIQKEKGQVKELVNKSVKDSPLVQNNPQLHPKDSLYQPFPKTIKSKYVISVFLPLFFDSLHREQNQKTALSVSRDFYKGMMLAADTLKRCGVNLDIHFFDSEKFWTYQSLKDTILKNHTDLIIGPLLESHIKFMDSLSKTEHINYVSSLQSEEKCNHNEFYLQSGPSSSEEGLAGAMMVKKNLQGRKIFVINDRKTEFSPITEAFTSQFKPEEITVINCRNKGVAALPNPFPYSDSNVVFIPSKSESFVNQIVSKFQVDSQNISFVAPMQWQFFKSFEGEIWEKYKVHVLSPYFIDYGNPVLDGFIHNYRVKYQEEPSIWAFIGFDELVFYGNMLHSYGKYFQPNLGDLSTPMLHTTYSLRHSSNGCGWQNEFVNVLDFHNYQLNQVAH